MTDYLAIYLRDQLALGVVWRELARRSARSNRGTPAGAALRTVATGISQDVDTFKRIMRTLDIRPNPVKLGLAVAAERVGRAKLNGQVLGYGPLSQFLELDVLTMGILGKQQLWATLRDLAGLGARLPDIDFDALIRRAEEQRQALEPFRVEAGAKAFAARPRAATGT
jgi:hypothetical protein